MKPPFSPNPITVDVGPLVSAIAEGTAVLYVGAGVSISAGLPSWENLLKRCLARAKQTSPEDKWERAEAMVKENNFLMAAELLHKNLKGHLTDYLQQEIGTVAKPSILHRALARIPFSLGITTNYDSLLEDAFPDRHPTFTWQEAHDVVSALRKPHSPPTARQNSGSDFNPTLRGFPLIKAHGDLSKPSTIVLTRSQYRDLEHRNESFNECLKSLLAFRTFLFVGCSMTDPDILRLLDEVRMVYGQIGHHYAIMPRYKVDPAYAAVLKESFGIQAITYSTDANTQSATSNDHGTNHPVGDSKPNGNTTKAVFEILKHLSGKAAAGIYSRTNTLTFGHPLFSRKAACNLLLHNACAVTGSIRGDICLIKTPNSPSLARDAVYPPLASVSANHHNIIKHDSVIGWLFVQRRMENDYVIIPDVAFAKKTLVDQDFTDDKCGPHGLCAHYHNYDERVRCELACPIFADAECIGVLNLESDIVDAYTHDHLYVTQRIADEIGSAYIAAKRRKVASERLAPCLGPKNSCDGILRLTLIDQLLNGMDLRFILWVRDYERGKLYPRIPSNIKPKSNLIYSFGDDALAVNCYKERRRIGVFDTKRDQESNHILNSNGIDVFNINGPVLGQPIRSHGHLSAVLVVWSADNSLVVEEGLVKPVFWRCAERLHRIIDVVANIPDHDVNSNRILNEEVVFAYVSSLLSTISQSNATPSMIRQMLQKSVQCSSVVPFGRIRLWLQRSSDGSAVVTDPFVCAGSFSADAFKDNAYSDNEFIGRLSDENDSYARHTVRRAKSDPYARVHDPQMFGDVKDVNYKTLRKDPTGCWVVGPIVKPAYFNRDDLSTAQHGKSNDSKRFGQLIEEDRIFGFVTIDNHKPDNMDVPKDVIVLATDESLLRFQRRVVDLITHILSEALYSDTLLQELYDSSVNRDAAVAEV